MMTWILWDDYYYDWYISDDLFYRFIDYTYDIQYSGRLS